MYKFIFSLRHWNVHGPPVHQMGKTTKISFLFFQGPKSPFFSIAPFAHRLKNPFLGLFTKRRKCSKGRRFWRPRTPPGMIRWGCTRARDCIQIPWIFNAILAHAKIMKELFPPLGEKAHNFSGFSAEILGFCPQKNHPFFRLKNNITTWCLCFFEKFEKITFLKRDNLLEYTEYTPINYWFCNTRWYILVLRARGTYNLCIYTKYIL